MKYDSRREVQIGGGAEDGQLISRSENVAIRSGQVMLRAAEEAAEKNLDPAKMLRVLTLMAAPVHAPGSPNKPPASLDLQQEWHLLAESVRQCKAPILLARLTPPTLAALRYALSPRALEQGAFPNVLHFSGHAWQEGLLLEDDLGQVAPATAASILHALKRHREAAHAFGEGLQHLAPFYRALPQAFGGVAGALLRDYLQACKIALMKGCHLNQMMPGKMQNIKLYKNQNY